MLVDKTQLSYFYWVHSVFCWFACLLGVLFHFSPKSFTNGELLFSRIYMSRLGHCPLISLILWLTNLALESQPSLLLALPRQRWVYKLPPWWIRCHVPCRETGVCICMGWSGKFSLRRDPVSMDLKEGGHGLSALQVHTFHGWAGWGSERSSKLLKISKP